MPSLSHSNFEFLNHKQEAFLTLETRIRKILGLLEDCYGINLIQKAEEAGVFKRTVKSEENGLKMLYRGAILWFRNPPGHKKVKYDKKEAIELILFADYLIKLFEKLVKTNKSHTPNHSH